MFVLKLTGIQRYLYKNSSFFIIWKCENLLPTKDLRLKIHQTKLIKLSGLDEIRGGGGRWVLGYWRKGMGYKSNWKFKGGLR